MKSPDERGAVGAWAYEARIAHDWSVEQVIEKLPTLYHPATLRKVESGSAMPGRRMLRELADLYGSEPPGKPAVADQSDLAAAIRALTEELRAMREEREMVEVRLRALEAELPRRAPGAGEALRALSVPHETAGSGS